MPICIYIPKPEKVTNTEGHVSEVYRFFYIYYVITQRINNDAFSHLTVYLRQIVLPIEPKHTEWLSKLKSADIVIGGIFVQCSSGRRTAQTKVCVHQVLGRIRY